MKSVRSKPAAEVLNKEIEATKDELAQVEKQLQLANSNLYRLTDNYVVLKEQQTNLLEKLNSLNEAVSQIP